MSPEILYAISTCEKYHGTRAQAVYSTWCNNSASCIFYSDHKSQSAPWTIMIDVEGGAHLDDGSRRVQHVRSRDVCRRSRVIELHKLWCGHVPERERPDVM